MQVHTLELLPVTPGCSMYTELTRQQLDTGTGRVGWAAPHQSLVYRPGEPFCLLPDGKEQCESPGGGGNLPEQSAPNPWAGPQARWRLPSLGAPAPLRTGPGFPWQAQCCPGTVTPGVWHSLQKRAREPPAPRHQHSFGKWCPHR